MPTAEIPRPPAPTSDLGGPLGRSLILHTAVVLALWAAFGVQERRIEAQETRVREEVQQKQEELAREQERLEEEAVQTATADEIRMMLTALLHDTVPESDLDQLMEQMEVSLEQLFAQQEDLDWLADDPDLRQQLLEQALADLRQQQEDLLAQALVEQIRSYVREDLVPDLRAEIENRLKNHVGKQVEREASKALQQAQREGSLAKEDTRAAAAAASDAIEAQVDQAAEKAVREELVPKAGQRVMEAFAKEIAKLPIDAKKLSDLVANDIQKALDEELSATDPSASPATTALAQRYQLADAQALQQAQDQVAQAAETFSALAAKQAEIREDPPDEAIDKQPAQQRQVADVTQAYAQAQERVAQAQRVAADDRALAEARKQAQEAKGQKEAEKADKQLRNGVIAEAVPAMQASEADLSKAAESMRAAAQALGEQAAAAAAQQPLPTTASAATLAAAAQAAQAAAETSAGETTKAVAGAAQQVRVGQVLGDAERLAQLAELGQRLEEAGARMAEGRDLGSPSLLPGASLLTGGSGSRPGGRPGQGMGFMHNSGRHAFNRAAYEAFVKDLQNRINPENAYGDIVKTEGLVTRHQGEPKEVAARGLVTQRQLDRLDTLRKPAVDAPERKVADPDFPTPAWGGAPMNDVPLTIDGDLSDWGDLTHPLRLRWEARDAENQIDSGIDVHIRWSAKGLFAAYTVQDGNGIVQPPANGPWDGDAFEWWLDLDNSRRNSSGKSDTAYQFLLAPFGVAGADDRRAFEYTHGQRQMKHGLHDLSGRGFAAGRQVAGGYSVEVYISRDALIKPILLPGQVLALNVSVNLGRHADSKIWQWSSSKAIGTFAKPDTWGDVVLLGADAKLRFFDATTADSADDEAGIDFVLPGQALGLEVKDADMNIREDIRDRVPASLGVEGGGDRLFVILEETGPSTGVFRASVDTAAFLAEADDHTVAARPGDLLCLTYQDPRAAYGEQNREIRAWLPVAHPVQQLNRPKDP